MRVACADGVGEHANVERVSPGQCLRVDAITTGRCSDPRRQSSTTGLLWLLLWLLWLLWLLRLLRLLRLLLWLLLWLLWLATAFDLGRGPAFHGIPGVRIEDNPLQIHTRIHRIDEVAFLIDAVFRDR